MIYRGRRVLMYKRSRATTDYIYIFLKSVLAYQPKAKGEAPLKVVWLL